MYNKEIQDHLLGGISECDNSMKALYVARKIESKHEQCKLLGIVNPSSLTSIDAIKQKFPGKENIVIFVDAATREASRIAQLLVKLVTNVVERTTLKMYANLASLDLREDQTEIGHTGPRVNVPIDVIFMKLIAVMTAPRIVLRVQI